MTMPEPTVAEQRGKLSEAHNTEPCLDLMSGGWANDRLANERGTGKSDPHSNFAANAT